MPLTWKLSDWMRGVSMKQRLRRQTRRTRLPVESLERRVVPAATGSVSGFAFIDANGNGVKDFLDLNGNTTQESGELNELVVKGATLRLTGTSDAGATVNAQTTTNQQGAFSFTVVPAGTYKLKADSNAATSGTLGNGVTVTVGTTLVPKDVPINCAVVTGEFLLNPTSSITELDQEILNDFPLPTAGTGISTGINEAPTLRNGQPVAINVNPTAPTTVDLTGVFDDPNIVTSQVQIHTSGGDVNVDLLEEDAPQTVQNFYNYVNSGAYDNSIFHRLASGFVLQGGGFKYNDKVNADSTATPPIVASPASITAIPTNPAVKNEFDGTNRSNLVDTIAMAKLDGDPDSATNQFFFNLANNSSNLDNQNGGFTVFGRLVGPDDTAVVNSLSTTSSTLKKFDASSATGVTQAVRGALDNLPLKNYANGVAKTTAEINATNPPNPNDKTGSTFPTDTTASNFLRITGVDTIVRNEELTYSVVTSASSNLEELFVFSNPSELIKDNRLVLNFKNSNERGTATIVVRATDKHGVSTGTVENPDAIFHVKANVQPVFTSSVTPPNVPENTTPVTTVTATDSDTPVTFAISGGADQTKFDITTGGVLTFETAPNFEIPTDVGANNVYEVQVTASDSNGGSTVQNLTVRVIGANDVPVFASSATPNVVENTTTVETTVTDADLPAQSVTLTITGGLDQTVFGIVTGVLKFNTAPDFESPTDDGANNTYEVQVTANDGNGGTVVQNLTITVTDANDSPLFTSIDTYSVDENTPVETPVTTVTATDADSPAQTVIFTTSGGADESKFNLVNGVLTFKTIPDFENPTDTDANGFNTYVVEVQAEDGFGGTSIQLITVTVLDVVEVV